MGDRMLPITVHVHDTKTVKHYIDRPSNFFSNKIELFTFVIYFTHVNHEKILYNITTLIFTDKTFYYKTSKVK